MSSLDAILRPSSIAVIGASRAPHTIGHEIVAALLRGGFTGPVYPVNPKARSICAVPAFPDLRSLPGPVDQAIVVVPAALVRPVVEQCVDAGVKGLVVISAGFREIGPEGAAEERALVEYVRRHGVRMVGPNCMGVLNADPAVAMNGTFYPNLPPFGRAAFVSQSGALGLSVLDYTREYGIGIAQFVSVGNKADVSGNDLLEAWERDPGIDVILMYVESFGNPRKFLQLASRISKTKPIIAVKSGRSRAGAQAASSHTGALAASDVVVDAMLTQAGVLRAESVEELFDFAMAFSGQPLPRSRRTAVLTNAGGPGILAADALDAKGLELAPLSPETVEKLRPLFPSYASIRNPLDMIASATPAGYRTALSALLADPAIDSVEAIFVPPLGVSQVDVSEAIATAALAQTGKPVLAVLMGHEGLPQGKVGLHQAGVPAYVFPESAARALAALRRQAEYRDRPPEELEPVRLDRERVQRALGSGERRDGKLAELEALEVIAAAGVAVAEARLVRTGAEAREAARAVGLPVALKVVAPAIVHKTDVGGVALGLETLDEVTAAYDALLDRVARAAPAAAISGVLVERMAPPGREAIVGATRESSFGPVVMVGLGGIYVEVFRDVAFRLPPFSRGEVRRMIGSLRGIRLLDGIRGMEPADLAALEDAVLGVAQLMLEFPEIAELDVNPLLLYPQGARAVDARVVVRGS